MKLKKFPFISLNKKNSYFDSGILTTRERAKLLKYHPLNEEKKSENSSFQLNDFLKKKNLKLIQNNDIRRILFNFSKSILNSSKSSSSSTKHPKILKIKVNKNNSMILNSPSKYKLNEKISLLNSSILFKSKSQNIIKQNGLNNIKLPIFPIIDYTSRDSNYIIKGASEYSRNRIYKREKYDISHKILKNSLKLFNSNEKNLKGNLNSLLNTKKIIIRKKKQDTCFSKVNFNSKKLGSISLFGVFDGHGNNALQISRIVKDFFIDYFENSDLIQVCLSRDNYYSILTEAFLNCQNYLINNKDKLNIDVDFSGVTCCLVLYPNNSNNYLYCANCGDCKCVLYSNSHFVKLSYPHIPDRPSEAQRILEWKNNLNNNLNEENNSNNNSFINNNNISNIDCNINHININKQKDNNQIFIGKNMNYLEKIQEKDKFEKTKKAYLKNFVKLNISRSLGDLQAKELGIISEPEIVESNLKLDRGKICVIGTLSLWKYLTEEDVGIVVRKHSRDNNTFAACRELEELAREKWKKNMKKVDDITVVIIFLEWKR
jgi:serine/threonine protein phosphatase PrpC